MKKKKPTFLLVSFLTLTVRSFIPYKSTLVGCQQYGNAHKLPFDDRTFLHSFFCTYLKKIANRISDCLPVILLLFVAVFDSFTQDIEEKEKLNWLNNNAIPFKEIEVVDKPLAAMADLIKKTDVLGLGEDTHGTKEFYRLKRTLVANLVEKGGFDIIVIEDNVAEMDELNKLLQTGDGSEEAFLKYLSPNLPYREYLDFFKWLNQYNQSHEKKFQLLGMDIQSTRQCLKNINKIVNRVNYHSLTQEFKSLRYHIYQFDSLIRIQYSPEYQPDFALNHKIASAVDKFSRHVKTKRIREKILGSMDPEPARSFYKNEDLLNKCVRFGLQQKPSVNRDMEMARNISEIKKMNPGSKIIIWAHNGHIQKNLNRGEGVGFFLKRFHKINYSAIGLMSFKGEYSSGTEESLAPTTIYPLPPLAENSWNFILSQVNHDLFYLTVDKKFGENIPGSFRLRGIGLKGATDFGQYIVTTKLDKSFDAIFYLKETSAATIVSRK